MIILAGGKESSKHDINPEDERRWQMSRRTDLANTFGIVLNVPSHGQDQDGNWEYGRIPIGGMANQQLVSEFRAEMRELIRQHASALVAEGLLMERQAETLDSHPYSVGPAAQEWPKIFFEFYKDVQPILSDGASALGWGYFVKDLVSRIHWWNANKQKEVYESMSRQESYPQEWRELSITPVLTRPALIALCYVDLTKRYGIGDDLTIDTYPRSYSEYETPDHPAGGETYLIRLKAGKRGFYYLVNGKGIVSEHYLTTGSDITLLPIPNLLGEEVDYQPRQPQSSYRITIRAAEERKK